MSAEFGHVIVLDDDAVTRNTLTSYLNDNQVLAKAVTSRVELYQIVLRDDPSLVILNLGRRATASLDFLQDLRSRTDVPIIVTTGQRLDQTECIIGLELGADEYFVGPVNPRVLLARVRAVLRRFRMGRTGRAIDSEPLEYNFDGWKLECRGRRLLAPDGAPVPLTRNEYALLLAFVQAPLRPLTREHLLQATRIHQESGVRCIDMQVLRLRRKFRIESGGPGFIRTERGMGYTFAVAVVSGL